MYRYKILYLPGSSVEDPIESQHRVNGGRPVQFFLTLSPSIVLLQYYIYNLICIPPPKKIQNNTKNHPNIFMSVKLLSAKLFGYKYQIILLMSLN